MVVVSFAFTLVHIDFTRRLVEEDLAERAVAFAREMAATVGNQEELESGPLLERQIQGVLAARPSVLHLDILSFSGDGARLVEPTHDAVRRPHRRSVRSRGLPRGFSCHGRPHNRVPHVSLDGEVTEFATFDNIVPTGLAVSGNTVYMGPSVSIPVRDGRLGLGQFQRVVLVECEGPRERTLDVSGWAPGLTR